MRFNEHCPQCKHVENLNWRPRFMNIEEDIIEAENVPELIMKLGLEDLQPHNDGQWTYKLTRTRKWVYRIQTALFKANGDKFMPHGGKWKLGNDSGRRSMMQSFNKNRAKKVKEPQTLTLVEYAVDYHACPKEE